MPDKNLQIKDYLLCVSRIEALSIDDEARAILGLMEGDAKSRRLLEERYLPRVLGWAQAQRGQGVSFEGLIEAGNRALIKGLRSWQGDTEEELGDWLERLVHEEMRTLLSQKKI